MLLPLVRTRATWSVSRYSRCPASTKPRAWISVHDNRPKQFQWLSSNSASRLSAYSPVAEKQLSEPREAFSWPDQDLVHVQKEGEDVWEQEDIESLWQDAAEEEDNVPNVEYTSQLYSAGDPAGEAVIQALQVGNAIDLLQAALNASQRPSFLETLPPTTYMEILRTIQSRDPLNELKALYHFLKVSNVSKSKYKMRDLPTICADYSSMVQTLVTRWQSSGQKLGLEDYKVLLDISRATCDGKLALFVFNDMENAGIQPDTFCYNSLFEAQCWNHTFDPAEMYKLRVTPRHLQFRNPDHPFHQFSSYHTGEEGLKRQVIHKYAQMVRSGIIADAKTYSLLILALGREGDLEAAEAVLSRVWDVNVSQIMADSAGSSLFENRLPKHSPIYPTQDVLFTIAHVYGINNQIPKALRVVDHVSRKYSILLGMETWSMLAEWTFVLSSERHGTDQEKKEDYSIGQLPLASFENLWTTMTSEPYNVRPTIPMYNMRIKALWRQGLVVEMLEAMREARREMGELVHFIPSRTLISDEKDSEFSDKDEAPFFASEQNLKFELRYLTQYRNHTMMARWLRLVLSCTRWQYPQWQHCQVPELLLEFAKYRSRNGTAYNITTGYVHLYENNSFHRQLRDQSVECTKITVIADNHSNLSYVQGTDVCRDIPKKAQTRQNRLIKRYQERVKRQMKGLAGGPIRSPILGPPKLVWPWQATDETQDWVNPAAAVTKKFHD